ncbi:MAG: hypothetical protein ACOC4K_04285, partial [Verrucomicrobiota bacterium]
VLGLCVCLVVALILWLRGILATRAAKAEGLRKANELNGEVANLRHHLQTQMEINHKGNESLQKDIEELKATNNHLSQTIGALKQKPGRAEIRTLHLYEKALRIMNSRAPGFGPVWESALQDAEAEVQKEESGLLGWIRKPFLLNRAETGPDAEPRENDRD